MKGTKKKMKLKSFELKKIHSVYIFIWVVVMQVYTYIKMNGTRH